MEEQLTIGRTAIAARVNVETIRYYQRRGLLDEPQKPPGGHRRYGVSVVRRITFIKRAQQLGFTLEEIKGLLLLEDGRSCRETRLLTERKLALVEARIADLNRIRRLLKDLIGECKGSKPRRFCPIVISLFAGVEPQTGKSRG